MDPARRFQGCGMAEPCEPFLGVQELRSYLHTHRTWLAGLLAGSSSNAGHNGPCHHSQLLSRLLSGLLRCCDPEVGTPTSRHA